jgi:hypothetical protein
MHAKDNMSNSPSFALFIGKTWFLNKNLFLHGSTTHRRGCIQNYNTTHIFIDICFFVSWCNFLIIFYHHFASLFEDYRSLYSSFFLSSGTRNLISKGNEELFETNWENLYSFQSVLKFLKYSVFLTIYWPNSWLFEN